MSISKILLLMLVIYVVPVCVIGYWVYKKNKQSDIEYEQKLHEIDKKWGVK